MTQDGCGELCPKGEDHYIVKIEVFAAHDPAGLTEADLDEDHMEAVSELLRRMEENDEPIEIEPGFVHPARDLCSDCRKRFLRDPLGRENAQKFQFSKN